MKATLDGTEGVRTKKDQVGAVSQDTALTEYWIFQSLWCVRMQAAIRSRRGARSLSMDFHVECSTSNRCRGWPAALPLGEVRCGFDLICYIAVTMLLICFWKLTLDGPKAIRGYHPAHCKSRSRTLNKTLNQIHCGLCGYEVAGGQAALKQRILLPVASCFQAKWFPYVSVIWDVFFGGVRWKSRTHQSWTILRIIVSSRELACCVTGDAFRESFHCRFGGVCLDRLKK